MIIKDYISNSKKGKKNKVFNNFFFIKKKFLIKE